MNNCCTASDPDCHTPKKHRCPANGKAYVEVSVRTITHHLMRPWEWKPDAQRYFFCDDPDCELVYFGEDGCVITQVQLRTPVGIKDRSPEATLCYCYGISRTDANKPGVREYVVGQTRDGACACETRNPSGRCCLKDFPDKESVK